MATKKTKQPAKSKKHMTKSSRVNEFIAYIKLHRVASIIIALVVIGLAIYGTLVLYEKWQFKTAEKQLDSLYSSIVSELGEPTTYEKNASCGYSSAKFSKGTLGCGVSYVLEYDNKNESQIKEDIEIVKQLLDKELIIYSGPFLQYSLNNSNADNDFLYGSYDVYLNNIKLTCSISLVDQTNNTIKDKEMINFGCGKTRPLTKPYPVKE